MTRNQALAVVIRRVQAALGADIGVAQAPPIPYDDFGLVRGRVIFEDDEFDSSTGDSPWMRVSMRHLTRRQEAIGSNRLEVRGSVIGQLFTRMGGALDLAAALADRFALLFTQTRVYDASAAPNDSIVFNVPLVREGGIDGRWLITVVEAPFIYYDTV